MGEIVEGKLTAGFTWNYSQASTNYNGFTVVRNRDGERTTATALAFTAELGLTQNFGVTLSTAYAWVMHQTTIGDSAVAVEGMTDLMVGVMYDVIGDGEANPSEKPDLVVTPFLGARIPLGNPGGALVHAAHAGIGSTGVGEDIRTTNGTFAPVIGVSAILRHSDLFLNALHVYFSPELFENPSFYRGGSSISVSFNTWTKSFKFKDISIVPYLNLDYAWVDSAERQNRPIINSGSHTFSVTPQILLWWKPGGTVEYGDYSLGVQMPLNIVNYRYGSDYYQYEGQLAATYTIAATLMVERDFF